MEDEVSQTSSELTKELLPSSSVIGIGSPEIDQDKPGEAPQVALLADGSIQSSSRRMTSNPQTLLKGKYHRSMTLPLVIFVVGFLVFCIVVIIVVVLIVVLVVARKKSSPIPDFTGVRIPNIRPIEDSYEFASRKSEYTFVTLFFPSHVSFSSVHGFSFQQIIGAANEFKEGDAAIGVAAAANDYVSRQNAKILLGRTPIWKIHDHPLFEDKIQELIWSEVDESIYSMIRHLTLTELKDFLLAETSDEDTIRATILPGLDSHVIGSLVKILSNEEIGIITRKLNTNADCCEFGQIGYLGARIQPNSPTDDVTDILIQVLDAFAYGVGDVVIGTNPVDVTVENVLRLESALRDIVQTFGLEDDLPWCVLADLETQFLVEKNTTGSTRIWFQSLAGTDAALETFGYDVDSLLFYADERAKINNGYSFYFETGQGADFSNGHAMGFDMVVHESNKYSLARILKDKAGGGKILLNDVANFIGPEILRTKEQLLRCVLEDLLMGKLNGLPIGLDICTTVHQDVSLDDLEYVQTEVCRISNPGYLMALPTKNDPMLSYYTTDYHDHLRLRREYGFEIASPMASFFRDLGIFDATGSPVDFKFGQPQYVYYKYLENKNDPRFSTITDPDLLRETLYLEAETMIAEMRSRNVLVAEGSASMSEYWRMKPSLESTVNSLYEDAHTSVWSDFESSDFISQLQQESFLSPFSFVEVGSSCGDRQDYLYHPPCGEVLTSISISEISKAILSSPVPNVVLVISDGLNPFAITDSGHVIPFLEQFVAEMFSNSHFSLLSTVFIAKYGRVRLGYDVGDLLFKDFGTSIGCVVHLIGERPGTGHHSFSAYISVENGDQWAMLDHQFTKVVAGISNTALDPEVAALRAAVAMEELYEEQFTGRRAEG